MNNEIIKHFEEHKITIEEKNELEKQLKRKGYPIYYRAIELLISKNIEPNYNNVKNIIILDKRFSYNLWKLVSSLEENIRTHHLNNQLDQIDWSDYKSVFTWKGFLSVIKSTFKEKEKEQLAEDIKWLRDRCAHLNYFVLSDEVKEVINKLNNIKEIEWIDNEVIDICIDKLKNIAINLSFEFYSKYFK